MHSKLKEFVTNVVQMNNIHDIVLCFNKAELFTKEFQFQVLAECIYPWILKKRDNPYAYTFLCYYNFYLLLLFVGKSHIVFSQNH